MSDGHDEQRQGSEPAEAAALRSQRVEQHYREYGRELWAMFYAVCCDPERAWDAVQHAFLKLQEQNGTPIHDARAWLLQVGKNWLRDVARRREHAWRAPASEQWNEPTDRGLNPAAEAGRADLLSRVRRTLGDLRIDDREVLLMRYALGWSSARIADTLGSTVQAIDMRLSRARQRLGVLLTEAGISGESLDY